MFGKSKRSYLGMPSIIRVLKRSLLVHLVLGWPAALPNTHAPAAGTMSTMRERATHTTWSRTSRPRRRPQSRDEGDVVREGWRCEEHQSQSECSGDEEIGKLTYWLHRFRKS